MEFASLTANSTSLLFLMSKPFHACLSRKQTVSCSGATEQSPKVIRPWHHIWADLQDLALDRSHRYLAWQVLHATLPCGALRAYRAIFFVVWKVRATLIVDWLLLDTLVTASPPKKKNVLIPFIDCEQTPIVTIVYSSLLTRMQILHVQS